MVALNPQHCDFGWPPPDFDLPATGARRELFAAMREIAASGRGPQEQIPSIGRPIKWRE